MKRGSKNIFLLGSSSMFNDVGAEMITPILPFFITSLGGGGTAVGLISGLREGLSSLFKLFGGYFSDKTGKRMPFVFFGYLFSIIARFSLLLSSSWYYIVGIVSLERFGKMRDAPRDAIIADSMKKQGEGFGIHQMMDTVGGILGVLLVIFLFYKFGLNYRLIIITAATISLLALIPLAFVKAKKEKKLKRNLFSGIKELNPKLKYFILVASIFTLSNFGLYMFLILRAKQLTNSFFIPLILYALFNIVWAVFTIPFGILSDKIGRKKVLLMGYVLFFLVCLGFIYNDGIIYLGALFLIYGLVYAITQSNQKAYVSDLSPQMKATALGLYHSVVGVVNIFAGLIAGILWDINYTTMFSYLGGVSLIAIVLLYFVKE
jgi:MFS family permease